MFGKIKLIRRILLFSGTVAVFFLFVNIALGNSAGGKPVGSIRNDFFLINRISGFVFDEQRNPISDIYVELQDELYRSVNRVRTDGSGRYVFAGMSEGNYYVRVIPTVGNFEEQIASVEIVNLGPKDANFGRSDEATHDFYLRVRKINSDVIFEPGVVFAQEVPKDAKEFFEKGVSHVGKRNYEEAIKSFDEAIKIFPTYFLALTRMGYMYFEQKKFDLAADYFARAADVNPKSEPTIYLLAHSVFETKRYDAAITFLQGAIELQHDTHRIHLLYGKALRAVKKFEEAEKELKKATSLDATKNAEPYWELALLYGNNFKKYGDAADQLEIFLTLQPESKDKEKIKALIQEFRKKGNTKKF